MLFCFSVHLLCFASSRFDFSRNIFRFLFDWKPFFLSIFNREWAPVLFYSVDLMRVIALLQKKKSATIFHWKVHTAARWKSFIFTKYMQLHSDHFCIAGSKNLIIYLIAWSIQTMKQRKKIEPPNEIETKKATRSPFQFPPSFFSVRRSIKPIVFQRKTYSISWFVMLLI